MSKNVAYYGVFAALAILMGYIESIIPLPIPIPGIKLGLANVIVLIVLYYMDAKSAFFISLVRIMISGVLFGGFAGLLYSMSGALVSFLLMVAAKKTNILSITGVSVLGGIGHNAGQIIVACIVVNNSNLLYYFPVLLVAGVITGVATGIAAKYSLYYLQNRKI